MGGGGRASTSVCIEVREQLLGIGSFHPHGFWRRVGGGVAGLKLRLPGLVASTFAHWAVSLAPNFKS